MVPQLKNDGEVAVVEFKDTHNSIVNSIRRTIIDEVPTFAIEDVEVVLNESPLYDETIAHRLGLIPLTTDLESYNLKKNCTCGGIGCALCEVKLTLAVEGDGYVLSSELKSDDPQVVPADTQIPITKLFGDKKIELNLKAELGVGREHAKWAPAHVYLRETESDVVELVIESHGQLEAKSIYNKALDILIEKITKLEDKL